LDAPFPASDAVPTARERSHAPTAHQNLNLTRGGPSCPGKPAQRQSRPCQSRIAPTENRAAPPPASAASPRRGPVRQADPGPTLPRWPECPRRPPRGVLNGFGPASVSTRAAMWRTRWRVSATCAWARPARADPRAAARYRRDRHRVERRGFFSDPVLRPAAVGRLAGPCPRPVLQLAFPRRARPERVRRRGSATSGAAAPTGVMLILRARPRPTTAHPAGGRDPDGGLAVGPWYPSATLYVDADNVGGGAHRRRAPCCAPGRRRVVTIAGAARHGRRGRPAGRLPRRA